MTGFGLVRGLAVFVGRRLTTPERLIALHRRLEELLPTAQRAIVLVQAAVLAVAAGAAWGPAPGIVLGRPASASTVARRPRPATRPARRPPAGALDPNQSASVVVVEVVLGDLEVPHVGAVAAAVGDDVTHLPAELGWLERHAVAGAPAVDADDGVGDGHAVRLARRA